ncbi:MAG: leucine-rich repeat domain-containing protein, partial [Ruminococcaceae bacterium]|nr:leucine-rich repeat domain-containing protein [Oscillospiraceae bacterium]
MKRTFLFFLPLIVLLALSGCNTYDADIDTDTDGADSENSTFTAVSDEAAKEADAPPEEDFEYAVKGGNMHIKKYLGNETVVVIPETIEGCAVKSIDAHFLDGSGVEEITYPGGMTEFRGLSVCENLKTLHLPASIEKMQDTLRFCENLTVIDIEEGGAYKTFEGVLYTSDMKTLVSYPCGRTGSFTVPEGVESIGKNAFFNSKLSEVVLPYGMESIGAYAFDSSKLSKIVLPDSLKTVEDYAFANAEALTEAVVPASVSSIGVGAFRESGLEKITLSEGLKEIMSNAFCGTSIKELYIPASVTECGYSIADGDVRISASYPSEGLKRLLKHENVDFRDETRLEEAFRKAESIVDEVENGYYSGVIITDITGDNFPEIMRIRGIDWISIYFFSEKGEWQVLTGSAIDSGYCRGDLAFYLLYDKENDTYSYYSGVYDFTVWGSISSAYVPCQCKLSFTEEGMVQTDLFNDDIIDISDAEIIETMDISEILNGIAAEYNIDFEDEYKKFTVIADGLAEEPEGKIFEKTLTLNGKTIDALPYFKSAYPEEFKLTVAGKDILRGEEISGVYFKQGMLTLDNAVIDAGGEDYVI